MPNGQQWLQSVRQAAFSICKDVLQEQFTHCGGYYSSSTFLCAGHQKKRSFLKMTKMKQAVLYQAETKCISAERYLWWDKLFPQIWCLSSALVHYRQCQNNKWDFCIYWGNKSFQSLYSPCTPLQTCVERRGRLCFHNNLKRMNFCL